MSRLRIALPPLASLTLHCELEFARLATDGQVRELGRSHLMQLGQGARPAVVECFLHPTDTVLTSIEVPPLSAAKVTTAVGCAAQALILGDSALMYIAHGPRGSGGQVHLSWLPKAALEHLARLLSASGVKLRGLYPAPYVLPIPPPGQVSACVLDGHLLLRHSAEQARVQPLFQHDADPLLAGGSGLRWIGEGAPATVQEHLAAQQRWCGTPPTWGLHGGLDAPRVGAAGWGRALACSVLAVAIWTLGLNLYAARQAEEGKQLKAQMSQRVKQAFPELPVILNPLQQARQQLAARQSGATADPGQAFSHLLHTAGNALPFMIGSVQRLGFADGRLQLELPKDTPPVADDGAWQATLAEAGLIASRDDHLWTLGAAAERPSNPGEGALENDDE